MKKNLLNCVLLVLMALTITSCKEEAFVTPPPESEINKTEYKSNSSYTLSLMTSDSQNSLELDLKNNLLYQEKFNVQSNLSSKLGTGSLTFSFDQETNNSFFPNNISVNSNNISYNYDEQQYNIPIEQKFLAVLSKMKEERTKYDAKIKDAPISWTTMPADLVINKLKEKGYEVISKEDNKYEISKNFQLFNDINKSFRIKMIFNVKSGLPESSELYKDGKKISENIFEVKNGKNIVHKKFYGVNSLRSNRNLIITKEY